MHLGGVLLQNSWRAFLAIKERPWTVSRAFLKVWIIHRQLKKKKKKLKMCPMCLFIDEEKLHKLWDGWKESGSSSFWKKKKKPPLCTHTHSDVLCALYRLAPRSSFSIRSAWWLACIMGSNVPWCCEVEQVPCTSYKTVCGFEWLNVYP